MQRCFQSVQWLLNGSTWPVLFKEQGSIKVWSCLWKWIMSWTKQITEDLGKRVDVAHQARKVTKPSLKSLDSTNPQSDRLCTNGWNSRPLLPSWEVVDQQRSLQSRRCNTFSFSHWLILIFMSPSSGEHWATTVCRTELQEERHCSPKRRLLAKDHEDESEDEWRKV